MHVSLSLSALCASGCNLKTHTLARPTSNSTYCAPERDSRSDFFAESCSSAWPSAAFSHTHSPPTSIYLPHGARQHHPGTSVEPFLLPLKAEHLPSPRSAKRSTWHATGKNTDFVCVKDIHDIVSFIPVFHKSNSLFSLKFQHFPNQLGAYVLKPL